MSQPTPSPLAIVTAASGAFLDMPGDESVDLCRFARERWAVADRVAYVNASGLPDHAAWLAYRCPLCSAVLGLLRPFP